MNVSCRHAAAAAAAWWCVFSLTTITWCEADRSVSILQPGSLAVYSISVSLSSITTTISSSVCHTWHHITRERISCLFQTSFLLCSVYVPCEMVIALWICGKMTFRCRYMDSVWDRLIKKKLKCSAVKKISQCTTAKRSVYSESA